MTLTTAMHEPINNIINHQSDIETTQMYGIYE